MRIAAGVEYCGTDFNGWQKQSSGRTIQDCIESAISKVANHPVELYCAGRTDTGVHALQQVIHFDTESHRENHSWVFGANSNLPDDVNISWVKPVDDEFHSRFSALSRQYRYIILNRTIRSSLLRNLTAWEIHQLDETLMAKSSIYLLGKHDFTSFRATACQARSPVREISNLTVGRHEDFIYIDVIANAFLHHMVRNIAGALIQVGKQIHPVTWIKDVLEARDRTLAAFTAPAEGLFLVNVTYPEKYQIPCNQITDWVFY